jgi:endonuclease G
MKYLKMLSVLATLVLATGTPAIAQQQAPPRPMQACAVQAPYGFPRSTRPNTTEICRTAYALSHDNNARVATWVVYTLTAQHAIGCAPRINAFAPDQSLQRGQRAELVDYANSGYDTGHIANNADMSWDPAVARESFILSNMAPQIPNLNRGIWKSLETAVRAWAFNSGRSLTIYAGSIYDLNSDRRIGPNQVIVPRAFYKIVINNVSGQSLAFVFPHRNDLGTDLRSVQTTVADIERYTGVSFPVPDRHDVRNPLWPIDLAPMTASRRTKCGG